MGEIVVGNQTQAEKGVFGDGGVGGGDGGGGGGFGREGVGEGHERVEAFSVQIDHNWVCFCVWIGEIMKEVRRRRY